ncbi:MAG: guanylate kinase [Patescibacteria group bacterium]|jgi:guanylate kinase
MQPVPILIVGPSGVGKSAVIDRILGRFPSIEAYKTTTTRPPRGNETKYHFVDRQEFARLIQADELLEWAEVHGNLYGVQRTHIQSIIDRGKWPIALNGIDVQGVVTYRQQYPDLLAIFLAFDSLDQLAERLRTTRPDMSEAGIAVRRATAESEMAAVSDFDHVIVNHYGQLDRTVDRVAALIEQTLGLHQE